ncbi:MAG TPA: hypothetical protein ENI07_23915 [Desulfobacterales bacterium]|nr:hypothetical protein [Desulfobacterales bacterium]
MDEYTLMTSQKNEILELIRGTTLDPFNFKWSDEDSKFLVEDNRFVIVSKLSYEDSPYYFIFDLSNQGHYSLFSPGEDRPHDRQNPGSWLIQKGFVMQWLGYLEREMRQPDLWDDIVKQKIAYDQKVSPDTANEPFLVSQAEQIAEGIEKIREYLLDAFQDDSSSKELINEKLDYLIDGSKRQGRIDWFHTCMGVLGGIATALAMSPDQTKNMWVLLKSAVSGILKLLPL